MNQPVVEKINCKGCTGTLNGYAGILYGCAILPIEEYYNSPGTNLIF